MKIGIDIRSVMRRNTGKGTYTFNLVRALLALDHENEYTLYCNSISGDTAEMMALSNVKHVHIKLIHTHALLWHFAVIRDFKRAGGELFFAPTSYIIPAFLPRKIASVITVHDLVAFLHPHLHESKATILEHLFFRMALRKTKHVIAPSEHTKKDLMRLFDCAEEKITVTPLGVDEKYMEDGKWKTEDVKKKYNLPENFILTVGGLEPRKNNALLIDAVVELSKKYTDLKLVIVGGQGWRSHATKKKIRAAKDVVIHIENCDTKDLPAFYRLAKMFAFPSLYEGFGLPPLEAMASGCPVICSNVASLPEVCGDSALAFDPYDKKALTAAIEKLLNDEKARAELIERGKKQAAQFTWKRTAEKTLNEMLKTFSL